MRFRTESVRFNSSWILAVFRRMMISCPADHTALTFAMVSSARPAMTASLVAVVHLDL